MVDTLIRESPSGPTVNVEGETGITLTTVRYVDPATPLDPADQTGSEVAPFETLQQAIDSLADAGIANGTIVCIDGDYLSAGASYSPVANDILQIVGFGSARNIGPFVIESGSGASTLTFQSLCRDRSSDGAVFTFTSNAEEGTYEFVQTKLSGSIIAPTSTVILDTAEVSGSVEAGTMRASESLVANDVSLTIVEATHRIIETTIGGEYSASGATFTQSASFAGDTTAQGLTAYDTTFGGNLTVSDQAEMHDCTVSITTTALLLDAWSCVFNDVGVTSIDPVTNYFYSCQLNSLGASGTNLEIHDSNFAFGIEASDATFYDCRFIDGGGVLSNNLIAIDCSFEGANTGAAGNTTCLLRGGRFAGQQVAGADITCQGVAFEAVTQIGSAGTTETLTIRDCIMDGTLTVFSDVIDIDSGSYNQAIEGGAVFTPATSLTFSDPPLSATVSIIVPAVGAGAVGYVDTSLAATIFAGLFAVNNPVSVIPQSDLVAAGAGGGFINARISAANTLRSAFVGPLAGGAANFTVTRVR
jgi:hypothetical protein